MTICKDFIFIPQPANVGLDQPNNKQNHFPITLFNSRQQKSLLHSQWSALVKINSN